MEPAAILSVAVAAANAVQSLPQAAPAGQQSFAATLEDALSATHASPAPKNTAETSDQHCLPLPPSREVAADEEKSAENVGPTDLAPASIAALIAAIAPPPVQPAPLPAPVVTTIKESVPLVEAAPVESAMTEIADTGAAIRKTETASLPPAHNPALPTTTKIDVAPPVSADRQPELHASNAAAASARLETSVPKTVDVVVLEPAAFLQNCDDPHSAKDEIRLHALNMPPPSQQSFPTLPFSPLPVEIKMSQGSPPNASKSAVAPSVASAPDPITRGDTPTSTSNDCQHVSPTPTSLPAMNCEDVPGILIRFVAAACNVPENALPTNNFSNAVVSPSASDKLNSIQDQPTPPTVDADAPATIVPLPTSDPAVVIQPIAAVDSTLNVAFMQEPSVNPVTHDTKLQRDAGKSMPAQATSALTRDPDVKDASANRPNPAPPAYTPATEATSHAAPLASTVSGMQSPADQSPSPPSQFPDTSPRSVQVSIAQADHTPAVAANHSPSANLSPVAQEAPPTPAPLLTNMARLVDRASEAEMHIGMRTELFGGVTLHASVRDNHVGIAIGSERGDLANFLARDDSGLKDALSRQSMRLDDVKFLDLSGGAAAFSDHRNRPNVDPTPLRLPWTSVRDVASDSHNEAQLPLSRRGLSVLA